MQIEENSSTSEEDSDHRLLELDGEDHESYDQSSRDSDVESENENPGNPAWAEAMHKVLNANVSKNNFILSKAKKDIDIKVKEKKEIELVDESGNVVKKEPDLKLKILSHKQKRKEMLEKQKQKIAWENMCRVKPDVTNKDKDRELMRIATRGVVHLFNTVEKHQKSIKDPKEKKAQKKDTLGAVKGSFMDILRSGPPKKESTSEGDPVLKKMKHEETWNILKDDFMMGAELKDWDKDSD